MVASDVFGAATDRVRAHAQPGLPRRARTATDFYSDMVPSSAPLHIYHRDIEADQHTSLTVVTGHIQSGDRVLDLGCGTGAIGRHLAQIAADIAGASISPAGKKTLRDAFSARKKAVRVSA